MNVSNPAVNVAVLIWPTNSVFAACFGRINCGQKKTTQEFTNADDGFVFDPRLFLKNEMCSNCFEGPIQLNITTKRVECDGRLLKSSEPKSNVCSMLNGHCCEGTKGVDSLAIIQHNKNPFFWLGVFGTFDPLDFPRMDCFVCYSGFVQQI